MINIKNIDYKPNIEEIMNILKILFSEFILSWSLLLSLVLTFHFYRLSKQDL